MGGVEEAKGQGHRCLVLKSGVLRGQGLAGGHEASRVTAWG